MASAAEVCTDILSKDPKPAKEDPKKDAFKRPNLGLGGAISQYTYHSIHESVLARDRATHGSPELLHTNFFRLAVARRDRFRALIVVGIADGELGFRFQLGDRPRGHM